MRALLLETDRHAGDSVARKLTAAGHQVLRCHEVDLDAFPCNALCAGGACPLEHRESVDVVVTFRAHAYPRPRPFEDGVSCALRHDVPLVVTGTSALNPFDRWTTEITPPDDIVAACERAVAAPNRKLSEEATRVVRSTLVRNGDDAADAAGAEVVVTRRAGRLQARAVLPGGAGEEPDKMAVAIAAVLRDTAPHANGIDVACSP
jgi:hypothetical protein